ncbi:MAG: hypothetical protein WBG18_15415 [Xanthobacteraceae bacterium]
MDGVKALAVLASIYYPGDGIVAKNNYQTSSGSATIKTRPSVRRSSGRWARCCIWCTAETTST